METSDEFYSVDQNGEKRARLAELASAICSKRELFDSEIEKYVQS
jgi:hypothetical protein